MPCKLSEDKDLEEYKEWYEGHKEECKCNYNGMEITMQIRS